MKDYRSLYSHHQILANTASTPTRKNVKDYVAGLLLGFRKYTTNQTGISNTLINVDGASLTVTVPTGVKLLSVELVLGLFNTSNWAGDQWRLYLYDGATPVYNWTIPESNSGSGFGYTPIARWYIENPTSGSHTYLVKIQRTNGSGTGATNTDGLHPVLFTVKIEQ